MSQDKRQSLSYIFVHELYGGGKCNVTFEFFSRGLFKCSINIQFPSELKIIYICQMKVELKIYTVGFYPNILFSVEVEGVSYAILARK